MTANAKSTIPASSTISTDEILFEVLESQLKTYPASSAVVLGSGTQDFGRPVRFPEGKFKSLQMVDIKRQQVVISKLRQADLLVTNLLLEKMGYDFFLNITSKVRPQFICCSFHAHNALNISEDGLVSRLLERSYELFSRNERSLPNGKILIQLDFTISSSASTSAEPARSSYRGERKELVSLSAFNVGFQKCDPLHQWGPATRDHYVIHLVVSGSGTVESMGNKARLSSGDCFICYPDTEFSYCADKKDPWEYAWIGFDGTDAAMILSSTDFTRDAPFIRQIPHYSEILEKIRNIYEARGNGFSNTIRMTGLLYQLLSHFIEDSVKEPVSSVAQLYVKAAAKYISENYGDPLSIEDIADYVGVSRSQLFRSFEQVMGMSPKEYLTDFRIKQACHLLESTTLSVTAIANSLGFDNSLYFSKAFRKVRNQSPTEYRKASLK